MRAVIDLLKRYAHIEECDDPRTVRAKVTGQVLTLDEALQGIIPALLALLDSLVESWACVRSSRIATWVWVCCTPGPGTGSKPVSS